MDLEPTQKCGSFEEGMTTKATLSLSSIECLSHVFKLSYTPYKKILEAFICLLTRIKYIANFPRWSARTQDRKKPMLCWDKIESHSSHLGADPESLSRMAVAAPQRPGWQQQAGTRGLLSQFLNINNNRNSPGDAGTNILGPQTSCDESPES